METGTVYHAWDPSFTVGSATSPNMSRGTAQPSCLSTRGRKTANYSQTQKPVSTKRLSGLRHRVPETARQKRLAGPEHITGEAGPFHLVPGSGAALGLCSLDPHPVEGAVDEND